GVIGAAGGQGAVRPADVVPAGVGELGGLGDDPGQGADLVVAAPGLVGLDQSLVLVREIGRNRIDQRPDQDAGDPGLVVGVIEGPGQPARPGDLGVGSAGRGGSEFGFPQRLAQAGRQSPGLGGYDALGPGGGQAAG